ncbi:hypothetical protein UFOVP689_50 [uncultured Caudovirales phage]|uniref:Tail completion protein n=1 Tax=uncultured Caudovirales phage TaxID=2100421 RepID=A0A6J5NFV1_9CAUD|nr:hypothetical protein UFOVP689_50 [uncultured Caudovirales phage]
MAATVSQVATGLQTRLATISGLRTFNYQPEQENPPFAYPQINSINYHRAYQGGDVVMDWTIYVIVGRWLDRTAHAALDDYLSYSGSKSVRAAIEGDTTLGGVCQTLIVRSGADITSLDAGGAQFLVIQMQVEVHG